MIFDLNCVISYNRHFWNMQLCTGPLSSPDCLQMLAHLFTNKTTIDKEPILRRTLPYMHNYGQNCTGSFLRISRKSELTAVSVVRTGKSCSKCELYTYSKIIEIEENGTFLSVHQKHKYQISIHILTIYISG